MAASDASRPFSFLDQGLRLSLLGGTGPIEKAGPKGRRYLWRVGGESSCFLSAPEIHEDACAPGRLLPRKRGRRRAG